MDVHGRAMTAAHRRQKVLDLESQRLPVLDRQRLHLNKPKIIKLGKVLTGLESAPHTGQLLGVGRLANHRPASFHEISGHIRRFADNAHLALGLQRQATGGDVGHTAYPVRPGWKCEPSVAHILCFAEHRNRVGLHFLRLRAEQHQQHVDVVNHHVQHDPDIHTTEGHWTHALHRYEPGIEVAQLTHRSRHGVVPNNVPDLEYSLAALGGTGNRLGFGFVRGQRLFDQASHVRLQ